MPIQVRGVLVHAISGTELSRVRTEFRLRLPEPINKSPLESRGPTLLCNHVRPMPQSVLRPQGRLSSLTCLRSHPKMSATHPGTPGADRPHDG